MKKSVFKCEVQGKSITRLRQNRAGRTLTDEINITQF
jgi:hypothetical protein